MKLDWAQRIRAISSFILVGLSVVTKGPRACSPSRAVRRGLGSSRGNTGAEIERERDERARPSVTPAPRTQARRDRRLYLAARLGRGRRRVADKYLDHTVSGIQHFPHFPTQIVRGERLADEVHPGFEHAVVDDRVVGVA